MNRPMALALALMRRQYGLASRAQLLQLVLDGRVIDGLVRRGRWERVHDEIYRVAGGGVPREQPHMLAVLRCGEGARLTGASVFALLGVEGFSLDDPPVVRVPRHRWIGTEEFVIHRIPEPETCDRAEVCGMPAVTPTCACLDYARLHKGQRLRVTLDAVRRKGLTAPRPLLDRALTAGRSHGASRIVNAVLSGTLQHESEGERMLAALFYGVRPALAFNVWLLPRIRVDAVWHEAMLVLEYQGRAYHTLPTDVEADALRTKQLEAVGYEVIEVRWEDLRDPAALRARVLAAMSSRLSTRHAYTRA